MNSSFHIGGCLESHIAAAGPVLWAAMRVLVAGEQRSKGNRARGCKGGLTEEIDGLRCSVGTRTDTSAGSLESVAELMLSDMSIPGR